MQENPFTNHLVNETSPYLVQHAHQPVDWYPWGEEALQLAKTERRPILVSIGYSACHWCHVMAHQTFDDQEVADLMNEYLINIKIDREERPDIDQVFMEALQAMGQRGGWPLNIFLTAEGKPFYGGTYFDKQTWIRLVIGINQAWINDQEQLLQSAENLTLQLQKTDFQKYGLAQSKSSFDLELIQTSYGHLKAQFDTKLGGTIGAPKFPMPSIWLFLLKYGAYFPDSEAISQSLFTMKMMCSGGIYDQVGGGFSRYSVDDRWFAPHFEKMLYDNAQLLEILSLGNLKSPNHQFKSVIEDTVAFLDRELKSSEGGFFSALDADSEGIEGKYYVWTFTELMEVLTETEIQFCKKWFGVSENGNWEHGYNILTTYQPIEENDDLKTKGKIFKKLFEKREGRIRPGLDDKILAAWNGLAVSGLCMAYRSLENTRYLEMAENALDFIAKHMISSRGELFRSFKMGKPRIDGLLEDYVWFIKGIIDYYEASFDEKYLQIGHDLINKTIKDFYDESEGFFFFTSRNSERLIADKKELFDNVIPSSNAGMAYVLHRFGHLYCEDTYLRMAESMVLKMGRLIEIEPRYLSAWAGLYLEMCLPFPEIVIIGKEALDFRARIDAGFGGAKFFVGSFSTSSLPLLQNRPFVEGETWIYVCENQTCQLPVNSVEAALNQFK